MAAETPQSASPSAPNQRGFTLQNQTGLGITDAHAYTTSGKDINLTANGPIAPWLSQNFVLSGSECLNALRVKFENGKLLARDHLNDCNVPRIVAKPDQLAVLNEAGGRTFPSVRSRTNEAGKDTDRR
jgi:hypothetical protein